MGGSEGGFLWRPMSSAHLWQLRSFLQSAMSIGTFVWAERTAAAAAARHVMNLLPAVIRLNNRRVKDTIGDSLGKADTVRGSKIKKKAAARSFGAAAFFLCFQLHHLFFPQTDGIEVELVRCALQQRNLLRGECNLHRAQGICDMMFFCHADDGQCSLANCPRNRDLNDIHAILIREQLQRGVQHINGNGHIRLFICTCRNVQKNEHHLCYTLCVSKTRGR